MMTFKEYFILLLLCHVVGDFYIQTKKMSENKDKNIKWVLIHCLYYWLTMLVIVLPIMSYQIAMGAIIASVFHMMIDIVKYYYLSKKAKNNQLTLKLKRNIFFTDQILHLLCLMIIAYHFVSKNLIIRECKTFENFFSIIGLSQYLVLSWILALLIIHKPANIAIQKLLIIYKPETKEEKNKKNTGRFIGTVERIIMLILLSVGQYSAIGLVLTAKSIARYDKISKEKDFAEYYLLGTLISTVIVIIISLFL